jgi:hypothetical protein
MTLRDLDGMRFLGADPRGPADDVERTVMRLLDDQIAREQEAAAKGS